MIPATTVPAVTIPTGAPPRNAGINYLRAFITLLVLEHHSILAYYPMAPGFAFLVGFNKWGGLLAAVEVVGQLARGSGMVRVGVACPSI